MKKFFLSISAINLSGSALAHTQSPPNPQVTTFNEVASGRIKIHNGRQFDGLFTIDIDEKVLGAVFFTNAINDSSVLALQRNATKDNYVKFKISSSATNHPTIQSSSMTTNGGLSDQVTDDNNTKAYFGKVGGDAGAIVSSSARPIST
ncbi:hypothetical protein J4N45_14480 [Vibrio sp. SCSIO 43140]|uniref:hypothetical protein n=1 Tax=Vibrio sp. SCSIO 43140 TaxID=2819100 RepID=UPI0020750C3D|nr:hypothetical protein [Vibrio sp. SCSIO 43140]USD59139.1 hypothetical protein J4N45_11410 [Vibrio sp. SCSIO 43140]USD59708.1 hypothetical protein J4N45_14480 [Vibrio sp. SCSIO 43140]